MKRCVAGAVIAAMLFGGTGCSVKTEEGGEVPEMTDMVRSALVLAGADMENFSEDSPKASEKLLMETAEYLEKTLAKKYPGVAFEMTACVRHGLTQSYDEFVLQPVGKPEQSFTARVFGSDDGYSMTDGYYGAANTPAFENWIQERLAPAEKDARVISTIEFQFPEKCGADTPLEEAVREPEFFSFTWILIPAGEKAFAERAEEIWKIIDEMKLDGDYAIYLVSEEVMNLPREEAIDFIFEHTDEKPAYADIARRVIR